MSATRVIVASTGTALAVVLTSGTAHADPVGATPNDPQNARTFCMEVGANPTPSGLIAAGNNLARQLSQDDTVDGIAYGLLYVCPEYRGLFAQAYNIYGPPQNNA